MAGLKEFKEHLAQDAALAAEVKQCKCFDELVELAEEKGFSFTAEEIEALTDLSTEELSKAAGGTDELHASTQILVSGRLYL